VVSNLVSGIIITPDCYTIFEFHVKINFVTIALSYAHKFCADLSNQCM